MNHYQNLATPEEREFIDLFLCAHVAPHSTQTPQQAAERTWTFNDRPTNDKLVRLHLRGEKSLALPPRWYPQFGNIDIDNPKTQAEAVFNKLDELQIRRDQYLITATPRHRQSGNFRINFKLQMNSSVATAGLQNIVLRQHFNFHNVETNPRPNVSDRLVCGFDGEFLDLDTGGKLDLDLRAKLDALKNLRPIEITDLPMLEAEMPPVTQINPNHVKAKSEFLSEAVFLREHGLQKDSYGRNDAQHRIIFLLWKTGLYSPEQAADLVKTWIREKHNGQSDAVNCGDWTRIDGEIDRQIKSVFALITSRLPDLQRNKEIRATRSDVIAAAKYAPGDAVKQKQFFNLLKFIRPNFHWQWITIRADRWRDSIAGMRQYKNFQQELEAKGLMVADKKYIIGSQSRKYKFNFQLDSGEPLKDADGNNIANYYEALEAVCKNGREIQELTKLGKTTLWRNKQ